MPLLQTAATAGSRGVLGDEDRMAAVRRLSAVLARSRRSQPVRDQLGGVLPHCPETAGFGCGSLAATKLELGPKRLSTDLLEPSVDLIDGAVHLAASLGATRANR